MSFKRLVFQNDFRKYVVTLTIGASVSQLIPILISPILTRIYSPEVFGAFSLFMAIVTIFSGFSNGRYDLAIVQPIKKEDACNLFFLGIILSIIFCLIVLLVSFFFKEDILFLDKSHLINDFIYLAPVAIFLTSCFSLLNYFNIREKNYSDIKNANIIRSFVMSSAQIAIGIIKSGVVGLILGLILSQLFSIMRLLNNILKDLDSLNKVSLNKMINLAKEYKNYPLYSSWGSVLNTASMQVPIIMLSSFYGLKTAGLYALTIRIVGIPVTTIGGAFSQVFYQNSCELRNSGLELSEFTLSTYRKLIKSSVIPFSILISLSDILLGFIFGKEWEEIGQYVQILSPWFLFVFLSSPLSTLLDTLEKQKQGLYFQICIFLSRITAIFIGSIIFIDPYYTVLIYGTVGFLFWFIFCIYLLSLVKINILTIMKFSFVYITLGLLLGISLRFLLLKIGL